ncbi:hypothetical protein OAP65_04730 [Litorivicinus sp.]|nr:hypothetical protein [Litorivicinus sp.]
MHFGSYDQDHLIFALVRVAKGLILTGNEEKFERRLRWIQKVFWYREVIEEVEIMENYPKALQELDESMGLSVLRPWLRV